MSENKELGSDMPKANVAQNIKNTVRDVSRLDLLKPITSRMKSRLAELKKLSSAETVVIKQGNVKRAYTEAPKMHIANLQATVEGGVGIISYSVYETDKNGNKKATNHVADIADGINADGSTKTKKVISSSSYEYEKNVIEKFQKGKSMKTEVY